MYLNPEGKAPLSELHDTSGLLLPALLTATPVCLKLAPHPVYSSPFKYLVPLPSPTSWGPGFTITSFCNGLSGPPYTCNLRGFP